MQPAQISFYYPCLRILGKRYGCYVLLHLSTGYTLADARIITYVNHLLLPLIATESEAIVDHFKRADVSEFDFLAVSKLNRLCLCSVQAIPRALLAVYMVFARFR